MNSVKKLVDDDHEYYRTSKLGDWLLNNIPYGWRLFYKCSNFRIWCISTYQRIRYGVSDRECWSLHETLTSFILPRLKHFKKMKRYAHVSDLTEMQWEDILDEIIWTFEYIKDEGETMNPFPIFRKDEPLDEYLKREKTEEEKQLLRDWSARSKLLEQRREKGLNLFAKYYIHLWD